MDRKTHRPALSFARGFGTLSRSAMNMTTSQPPIPEQETWFRLLFERSEDAILLLDPRAQLFVECNDAAMAMMRATDKRQILMASPASLSPARQPDGSPSEQAARVHTEAVLAAGTHRFEWLSRRFDGEEFPVEVLLTAIQSGDHALVAVTCRDISERKAHQEALRRSEEQFRTMFERSADAMTLFDPETGKFTASNRASNLALAGRAEGRIEGASPVDIAPEFQPDGRRSDEVIREVVARVLQQGSHRYEWAMRRLDGSETPLEIVTTAVQVGGRTLLLSVARNIEERKRMEADIRRLNASLEQRIAERTDALRKSEEKFKQLYERAPLGISQISWAGRFLQVNEAFARIVGRSVEECLQLTYWDFTPREYEAQELAVLEAVRRDGHFGPFEKEYIHADGHRVPIVLHAVLIRAPDGEEQLWGIVEDVTERKQAEQALRESEQSYRALFEASSQGVMLNDEKEFLQVNAAAARILGYRPEDFLGKHPRDFAAPVQPDGEPSDQAAARHINDCLREGQTRFEWVTRRADGTDVTLDVLLTCIEMGGRKIIQAMVTDISERKRAEAELKRALEHERELSQLKSNFVSMVSHEFRTPLGIIQSSAEILDDYLDQLAPAERGEQLRSIIKNSRRMAGLMEEVLVLGRLDAGRMHFQPAPLDPAALCRRLVDEVLSTTDAQCPVEFFTAGLPEEAGLDERLLRHILLNLLTNAVKYSEPGEPVVFRARSENGTIEFVVEDHGIGIPEDAQEQLFEAFHRGSNVGNRHGSGLGLVIVKRCVDLHGGTIAIQSRLGVGTTVTVTLPTRVPTAPPSQHP
jgi:PAS domain S-box-containing protein